MNSPDTGGVSTSWMWMFSTGIIPGGGPARRERIIADLRRACVRARTWLDLPEFGGPISAT
jgi:hypothetical protein